MLRKLIRLLGALTIGQVSLYGIIGLSIILLADIYRFYETREMFGFYTRQPGMILMVLATPFCLHLPLLLMFIALRNDKAAGDIERSKIRRGFD